MFRLRRYRLRYRKCYFLRILSALSICLIILYCLIGQKQHLMLLTFFNNNNKYDNNNNRNNNNNNIYYYNSNNNVKTTTNNLQHLTKKHVFDSNKQLRDWHNYIHTKTTTTTNVTRDHHLLPQRNRNEQPEQRQQQQQHQHQHQHQQQRQQRQFESQDKNTETKVLSFNKIGQMAITTNITYHSKLIENKKSTININNNNKNNKNNNKNGLQLTGFNTELSDSLPLERLIPDTRHKSCRKQVYPSNLPHCSIIIIYHNEQITVLLRTLRTILKRTPRKFLKEIILVDDFSDEEFEIGKLLGERLTVTIKKLRLPQREGLIRARLRGAEMAVGDVLIFLDAHVEVNSDWLPPLLAPIQENNKTCTTPIIDIIKYDTLEYHGSEPSRGGFNWQFNYVQLPLLKKEKSNDPLPHNNPVMNGGLFAIKREYFWHLGGYDKGLEIWGAEQFELSFKIWMCGGRLLEVPCSRVGHLYRDPEFRVKYSERKDDFISKNYKRVAEVWMDEYKEFLYEHIPKLNQIDAGDMEQQKLLRKSLQCKPFKWFLKTIAPDLLKAYPPIKPADFAEGAIQSLFKPELCLDLGSTQRRQVLEDVLKPCSPDLKYPYASQKFHLSFRQDLRHQGNCLEVQTWASHAPIWLWPCHNLGGNQFWYYNQSAQMLIHGKTDYNQRCLELDPSGLKIFVNLCDFNKREQKWLIGYVNQTAMEYFFDE